MANILIFLITLLIYLQITVSNLPPCSLFFTNIRNVSDNEVMSDLQLRSISPDFDQFHLKIQISLTTLESVKDFGRIQLERSIEESLRVLQSDHTLGYNVYLPTQTYISYVSSITLNGREFCDADSFSYTYVNVVELENILFVRHTDSSGNKIWLENSNSDIKPKNPYLRLVGLGLGLGFVAPAKQQKTANFPVKISLGSDEQPTTEPYRLPSTSPWYIPPELFTQRPITKPTTVATTVVTTPTRVVTDDIVECGRIADIDIPLVVTLISSGEETAPGEWPWLVAIFVVRTKHVFQCAGSLLTKDHVITAAHCMRLKTSNSNLPASSFEVSLGRYQLRNWWEEGSVNRHILNYVIHPDYAFGVSSDSDMAIMRLWNSIEFSPTIRPICLWYGTTDLRDVVNQVGTVVGWGKDEHGNNFVEMPRKARVPIVSQDDCFFSDERFISFTSKRTFCAGALDGSGPCNGDSGTGLVLYDATRNRYQLRGIVSRSLYNPSLGCDLTHYVVYVDVAVYIDWINLQISTL